MNAPRPTARRTRRALLGALGLFACGAGGFLLHGLLRPRPALYAAATRERPAAAKTALAGTASAQAPARSVPDRIPDISLPAADGSMHRLAEWRGRPLLINFWATWCEPCRREIPLLERLRRQHAAQGLEIVGIALDDRDAVRKYAAARGIDYPVLIGQQGGLAAAEAFGMDVVLPFSVFADGGGRLVGLKVGELHPDEAEFILDRVLEVDAGTLSLPAARKAISAREAARRAPVPVLAPAPAAAPASTPASAPEP